METYRIEITETFQKTVEVKADNYLDAIGRVSQDYFEGKISLTVDDGFIGTEFGVLKEEVA